MSLLKFTKLCTERGGHKYGPIMALGDYKQRALVLTYEANNEGPEFKSVPGVSQSIRVKRLFLNEDDYKDHIVPRFYNMVLEYFALKHHKENKERQQKIKGEILEIAANNAGTIFMDQVEKEIGEVTDILEGRKGSFWIL